VERFILLIVSVVSVHDGGGVGVVEKLTHIMVDRKKRERWLCWLLPSFFSFYTIGWSTDIKEHLFSLINSLWKYPHRHIHLSR
jgi:hypothetical protein